MYGYCFDRDNYNNGIYIFNINNEHLSLLRGIAPAQHTICRCRRNYRFKRNNMIDVTEFDKVEVRVGTVVAVAENKKARHPAYAVTIDFGPEIGLKKSSAQITALYTPDDLVGTQVVCCVNLQPMHIGSVKSEVRILGTDSAQGVVLLRPTHPVKNGDRVF